MKLILICGPWGSGTSAVAGMSERLGVSGLGPYFMTNDPNTPNSYESIPFRETIMQHVIEHKVSLKPNGGEAVLSGLRVFKQRYHHTSSSPIFLKYPLSALVIPQISEIFETKLIYVMRSLANIERTRLRRHWPAYLGAIGAEIIYQRMADIREQYAFPILTVEYNDLLQSPLSHACDIAHFAGLNPSQEALHQAVSFIR